MRKYGRTALVILAGWTMVALLFAPQIYLLNQRAPVPPGWTQVLLSNAITFYAWALLTPLVLLIGRWFPFERGQRLRATAVHIVAAVTLAFVHLLVVQAFQVVASGFSQPPRPLASLGVGYGTTNLLFYAALTAISQALMYFRRSQERERRLADARLETLRAQLHPHFLFNTLGAVAELIHVSPAKAEQTLVQLSDLLRLAMAVDRRQEVTLEEELEWLERYLDIWRTLLDDRLVVQWDVDDGLRAGMVPSMVLQPLVENALRHGITPRPQGGRVTISARRAGDRLVLGVDDDGVGIEGRAVSGHGVGLRNVSDRVANLYGAAGVVSVQPGERGGTRARVTVPWRE